MFQVDKYFCFKLETLFLEKYAQFKACLTRSMNYNLQEVLVNQPYETIYKACLKFDFREFQWNRKAFANFSSHQVTQT